MSLLLPPTADRGNIAAPPFAYLVVWLASWYKIAVQSKRLRDFSLMRGSAESEAAHAMLNLTRLV